MIMNQETINKLVDWIKANPNYSSEQLREAALKGGASEEEYNAAAHLATPIATMEYKGVESRFFAIIVDLLFFYVLLWLFSLFSEIHIGVCDSIFNLDNSNFYLGYPDLGCTNFKMSGSSCYLGVNIGSFSATDETFRGLCGFQALLFFLTIFMYYVLFEWKLGGTLGKLVTGMKVVKSTGEPLDLKAALLRNIMRVVDYLPFFYLLGAISIWTSKTKQRLGDKVANTCVVSRVSCLEKVFIKLGLYEKNFHDTNCH